MNEIPVLEVISIFSFTSLAIFSRSFGDIFRISLYVTPPLIAQANSIASSRMSNASFSSDSTKLLTCSGVNVKSFVRKKLQNQ